MRVHQCPKCELRFRGDPELRDHLVTDHGVDPADLERHLSGLREGTHVRRHPPDAGHAGTAP